MKIFAIVVAFRYPTDSIDMARLVSYSGETNKYILNEDRMEAVKMAELENVREFLNTKYGVGTVYLGWDLILVGSKISDTVSTT